MKEIEITIDADGDAEIDLKGFNGQGCTEITNQLVKALSGEKVKRIKKSEYYKTKTKEKIKQRL